MRKVSSFFYNLNERERQSERVMSFDFKGEFIAYSTLKPGYVKGVASYIQGKEKAWL